jgi:PKD repeat protein
MKNVAYKITLLSFVLLFAFLSCSDNGGTSNEVPVVVPSNLSVKAIVVGTSTANPNGDGSGLVNFKITANNAVSYKILVDGKTIEQTSGDYSYTFKTAGTNTFTVYVSAYNGVNFISSSVVVVVHVALNLIWSDEFNVDGAPNVSKWNLQTWDPGYVNDELQSYTTRAKNIIVEDGLLKITALREDYGKGKFTSGRIESNGKFEFTYGTIVIRAKVPTGVGTWPAVWMLGSNIGSVGQLVES